MGEGSKPSGLIQARGVACCQAREQCFISMHKLFIVTFLVFASSLGFISSLEWHRSLPSLLPFVSRLQLAPLGLMLELKTGVTTPCRDRFDAPGLMSLVQDPTQGADSGDDNAAGEYVPSCPLPDRHQSFEE